MKLEELFGEHVGFVWRSLQRFGVEDAAVDDAVQDVFVTAYRRWDSFEGRGTRRSWLFGIARRIAFRYRRAASSRNKRVVSGLESEHEPTHRPFERVQAAQSLGSLLLRLDRDKRDVFMLAEVEGMTANEVSEALDIPVGTANSRLRAAWQRLDREAGRERARQECTRLQERTPGRDYERRVLGLVAARLAAVPVAASLAPLATAKWVGVGAVFGAGLLAAGVALAPGPPARKARASAPRATHVQPPPAPAKMQTPPAAVAPAQIVPEPPAQRSPPTEQREAPLPKDALAEEVALVREGQRALRDGDPDTARAHLEEHARRFPDGQLADERRNALAKLPSSNPVTR